MDSTTHTTTTVEFVDWRAKAKEKLEAEDKMFKGGRAAASVQSYVLRALLNFADQEPRFAEVVCNTERTFSECCAAVVHNAGEVQQAAGHEFHVGGNDGHLYISRK